MKADILRDKFLDFFKSKKHKVVESDSLVPQDDPTILFTSAGMNQFKKELSGYVSSFKRAATAQRCLRTDDLDKVGKTAGHHTFFEMLGNFSFGDYFKEEAITFAREFLTQVLKIKPARLWVSVYKDDTQAYKIWKDKIKIPESKIIKLGDKQNFWPAQVKEKGPNGPCGPCSEIFFDQGNHTGCKRQDCNPACDCGRFVEVWNLVFTQFNRKEDGILEPLPKNNIDTGMGLERLAAVMQGVYSNFETDLFRPLVEELENNAGGSPNLRYTYAIADHIRAISFAIYDGVLPSNEGRGYVVRKIIRRSILHLISLGIKQPFLYKLVPVLSAIMKNPYPQLDARRENIAEIILAEEKSFITTLNSSDTIFKEKFKEFFKRPNPEKAGRIGFQLYDTYGLPFEITKDWLIKHNIKISDESFNNELQEQRVRSKTQSAMRGEIFDIRGLELAGKPTKFLGYKNYQISAKILKIVKDNKEVKKIDKNEAAKIILDRTVFYPEFGGQLGDTGGLLKGKNIFEVLDTQKVGQTIIHLGKINQGSFKKNETVSVRVDVPRRISIAKNHTATHLLQAALRKVLGIHVQQQGSLVAPDRLRFDFTHFRDISKDELERIEEVVNRFILNNYPLKIKQMPLAQAKREGALAFFAEKYEGKVRVISIGDVSLELCGGTHLNSTGEVGIFKIVQEAGVASGIRRIEAVTGSYAYKIIKDQESVIKNIASVLNVPKEKIAGELEKKLTRIKELEKQLSHHSLNTIKASLDTIIKEAKDIKGMKVITKVIENLDMDLLRKTIDLIKQRTVNSIIALGSPNRNRAFLVMGITADLCQKGLDATWLIIEVAKMIGGSGGGRKDFAQAGGNKPENFPQAFARLEEIIREMQ